MKHTCAREGRVLSFFARAGRSFSVLALAVHVLNTNGYKASFKCRRKHKLNKSFSSSRRFPRVHRQSLEIYCTAEVMFVAKGVP